MINIKSKVLGLRGVYYWIILFGMFCLSMGSLGLAQLQNEKLKVAELTPPEKISAMQQWQKENFDCMVDFGNDILSSIAPNGILFICGDAPIFTLHYLLKDKKLRPDIEVYDYDSTFFKSLVEPKFIDNNEARKKAEQNIIHNTKRPIYYMATREMRDMPEYKLKPCGLVYQLLRPEETQPDYKNILAKMHDLTEYLWKSPSHDTREMVSNDLYALAQNYSELGDKAKTTELMRRSAQIGYDVLNMNRHLGDWYVYGKSKEDIEEAIYYYLVAIQDKTKDQQTYLSLAYAYDKNGEKEKALTIYRKAIAINPKNSIAHFTFGYYLQQHNMDADAIQEYQTGLSIDSADGYAYYQLGLIYEQEGNKGAALANLEKSLLYLTDLTRKQDAKERVLKLKNK